MVAIRTGHVSVVGNYRENNEDSILLDNQLRFMVVADGMGGQNAGEKASAMAIQLFPQRLMELVQFEESNTAQVLQGIDKAIEFANNEILAQSEVDPTTRNMGTTIVFLIRVGSRFFIGGVGDSRGYQLRNGQLLQLTTDHTLTQALLDAGTISPDEAKTHRYRNVLYRYLGSRDGGAGATSVELFPVPGERYLLCSDGVTDGINDAAIAALLNSGDDPQAIAEEIVDEALKGGSKDNVSCIVILVD